MLSVWPDREGLEALVIYDEIGEILEKHGITTMEQWEDAELDNKAYFEMIQDIAHSYLLGKEENGNTN